MPMLFGSTSNYQALSCQALEAYEQFINRNSPVNGWTFGDLNNQETVMCMENNVTMKIWGSEWMRNELNLEDLELSQRIEVPMYPKYMGSFYLTCNLSLGKKKNFFFFL